MHNVALMGIDLSKHSFHIHCQDKQGNLLLRMIGRLKKIANGEIPLEQVDLNYYTHECREYERYCNLGWESGEPDGIEGYDLWNNAHTATLEDFKITNDDLFHPLMSETTNPAQALRNPHNGWVKKDRHRDL